MSTNNPATVRSLLHVIITHNPFYVISAVLTLYGLQLAFGDNIDPAHGWLQLELLSGYMLLLAATGVLIVRWGQVWEDARTLLLLVLLLIVALSVSFDRICLDNAASGTQFLTIGLAYSLLLCEWLLRTLKVRLPWKYRAVLYLQFATLFLYPPWLGHLSLKGRIAELAWYVLSFPTVVAAATVLLLPAARRRERGLQENGTPWSWPWYPWTLFAVLGIGITLRAVAFTYSFGSTKGFSIGFQPYFIIPLLLSALLVWTESCLVRGDTRPWWRLTLIPLALFTLSLPGNSQAAAQAYYLNLLQRSIGSPVQITAVLLLVFYGYLLVRGLRTAEWGMLATLGVLSIVDHHTVNLKTLTEPNTIPILAGGALLLLNAIRMRSAARLCAAIIVTMGAISYVLDGTIFVEHRGFLPIHLSFLSLILAGLTFDDEVGRRVRSAAKFVLPSSAVLTLAAYPIIFPEVASWWLVAYVLCLAALATVCWRRNRQFGDVISLGTCLIAAAGQFGEHYLGNVARLVFVQGLKWLVWGVICFLVGAFISLLKGGQIRHLQDWLRQRHVVIPKAPHDD